MTTSKAEATLDWYVGRFEREHKEARDEFLRLSTLFKDVCWYNFETACNQWKPPWHINQPDSKVELLGMHFTQRWNKNKLFEHGKFPVYYSGNVTNAPHLPPDIVLVELLAAKKYMQACEEQMTAPYDWAPGGSKYENLCRTTLVGKQCLYDPRKRKFSSTQ